MKKLQTLMYEIREWSDFTFGESQRTLAILHHLKKEVPELIEAIKKEDAVGVDNSVGIGEFMRHAENAKMEFADCFMLLLDAASHYDMTAEELIEVTKAKLEINRQRQWGKPDENGVVEHIKN